MRTDRFIVSAVVLCLVSSAASLVWSEAGTLPAGAESGRDFIARTSNDHFAKFTLDEAVALYEANTDAEKEMAKITAATSILNAKIILAAREKWGKQAETDVAHAIYSDTDDDDAHAKFTITGDHAVIDYKGDILGPVWLVLDKGKWKFDVAAMLNAPGDLPGTAVKYQKAMYAVEDRALQALAANKYANADALVKYLKQEQEKVGASLTNVVVPGGATTLPARGAGTKPGGG